MSVVRRRTHKHLARQALERRAKRRRRTAILTGALFALAIGVGVGAGSAFGFFATPGSGTGSVTSGQRLTVSASAGSPIAPLLPGGTGDVAVEIHNPNSVAITVVEITQDGPITADTQHSSCSPTSVHFTNQTGLSETIASGQTVSLDLPDAVSMDATAPSGCEGATFEIPVTISVVTP